MLNPRNIDVHYEGGSKTVIEHYDIRGDDDSACFEVRDKLDRFVRKCNKETEVGVSEYNVALYDVDASNYLGIIVAFVDHRDENLVEIDTDIAPYFVKTM